METDASLGTFMQTLKFQQLQTPMVIRQLFLGCFVDASDFEKVLTEQKVLRNSDGLNSEQPFIYINLVRDHELFIKSDSRF